MPDWISRFDVYAALAGIIAVGGLGGLLIRFGYRAAGLIVLACYAAIGFDGLAHYTLAPVSAHTLGMNLTIWLEVAAAAFCLLVVIAYLIGTLVGDGAMREPKH